MHQTINSASSIVQVILINIVLSGDNVLVVALAARQLPPRERRLAMIWGVGLAVTLQLLLTLVVSSLLSIPGLQLLGAILLAWIACRLLQEEVEPLEDADQASTNLLKAIGRIALADLVMSLDNVLAIAGVSQGDTFHLVFGLCVSIAIIVASSSIIMTLMNRFHWLTYIGTAILALTAAGMISHDLASLGWLGFAEAGSVDAKVWIDWPFRVIFLVGCLTSIRWWPFLKALQWPSLLPEARKRALPEPAVEVQTGS